MFFRKRICSFQLLPYRTLIPPSTRAYNHKRVLQGLLRFQRYRSRLCCQLTNRFLRPQARPLQLRIYRIRQTKILKQT